MPEFYMKDFKNGKQISFPQQLSVKIALVTGRTKSWKSYCRKSARPWSGSNCNC